MAKNYLNTNQLADLFKVDNSTIRRWTMSGKLSCSSSVGGHRKFSYRDILSFVNSSSSKVKLNLNTINNTDVKNKLIEYPDQIAINSLNRSSEKIDSLIFKLYMEGINLSEIFDNYIDKSLDIIQQKLDKKEISIAEEHIARKQISLSLNNFRNTIHKNTESSRRALCLNLENDIPDLAIDMIQIILESNSFSVHNAGSNTSLTDIKLLIEKSNFDSIFIYLCSRQCCTSTVETNLSKSIDDINKISRICLDSKINLNIGGPATKAIIKEIPSGFKSFEKFSEITSLI
ncbi:MAG: helix-turn-helix domain-containing protein [Pelagibacteraceae bacterium TMED124]|nr:hypothetical protein [Candidatus Neomarinimicrobiota bacterium]RPG19113.1 MAG: helix-turn-helix domain-containing protein [Pelagibacteraceae bacterium TMED124]